MKVGGFKNIRIRVDVTWKGANSQQIRHYYYYYHYHYHYYYSIVTYPLYTLVLKWKRTIQTLRFLIKTQRTRVGLTMKTLSNKCLFLKFLTLLMIIVVLVSIVQFELAYVFDHPKKDSVYFQIYLSLPLFSSREHRSSLLMSKSACLSCWMVSGRLYFLRYLKSLMVGLDSVYGLSSSMTPISTFSSLDKCIQFGLTQVSLSRNPANCSINSGVILRRSTNKDPKNS